MVAWVEPMGFRYTPMGSLKDKLVILANVRFGYHAQFLDHEPAPA